ncbi:MAG: hypothetical protein SGI98_07600 [Verrucomicrobiota bacterium]|nr:hypothetical protein [Verrucomicrobiota bacterium]
MTKIKFGPIEIIPKINDRGEFVSIGTVTNDGIPLRNPDIRFLPWFDTYSGDIFSRFHFVKTEQIADGTIIHLKAVSSNDYPFREKRDTSGDICFRDICWDAPVKELDFRIQLRPVQDQIDGHTFNGFKYWFEADNDSLKFHRVLDRQTWEIGATIEGNTQVLRSWLTPARAELGKEMAYSTAGFEHEIGCMPGNLWARWTLLPAYDLQRGKANQGVLLAYFDEVSLIRTVVEKGLGDNHLRILDMHFFAESASFKTNPKTILYCPDTLDNVDLMNLWTRMHDRERDKARKQFDIRKDGPPEITLCKNVWVNVKFDESYQDVIDLASELNADNVMIDPIWESGQTHMDELAKVKVADTLGHTSTLEKLCLSNQCAVIDWEVDRMRGGEEGLKKVCDYGKSKNINILSWIATHMAPNSQWRHGNFNKGKGTGKFGVFAAKESGYHPDTGYPGDCWPLNLNGPMCDYVIERVIDISRKTGLKGFLWDSFSNLGWWQLDYSAGTMKPQFERMAKVYADLANEGLYLMPEAITTFSSHSCLGMYGGDTYRDEDLGYSYDSCVHPPVKEGTHEYIDNEILRGKSSVDYLFQCIAHKRVPNMACWQVPVAERDPKVIVQLRDLFTAYKKIRSSMDKRTVLKDGQGVLWESEDGKKKHLFSFKEQVSPAANAIEVISGKPAENGKLQTNKVYLID